jgi:hypothetical protein
MWEHIIEYYQSISHIYIRWYEVYARDHCAWIWEKTPQSAWRCEHVDQFADADCRRLSKGWVERECLNFCGRAFGEQPVAEPLQVDGTWMTWWHAHYSVFRCIHCGILQLGRWNGLKCSALTSVWQPRPGFLLENLWMQVPYSSLIFIPSEWLQVTKDSQTSWVAESVRMWEPWANDANCPCVSEPVKICQRLPQRQTRGEANERYATPASNR